MTLDNSYYGNAGEDQQGRNYNHSFLEENHSYRNMLSTLDYLCRKDRSLLGLVIFLFAAYVLVLDRTIKARKIRGTFP